MRFNFETRTKFLVTGFALVVILIVGGAIWPTARDIYEINRDTINIKTYLEKKYKSTVDLRQSAAKIEEVKKRADFFSEAVYRRGDELKLITFLENVASKNKLTQRVQSANLDKPENQTVQLFLILNGAYADALRYLSDIEASNYFLTIARVQIDQAGGRLDPTTPSTAVNLEIDLQLYVAE